MFPLKQKLLLFTDGSVDTGSKIGYGAYLLVADTGLAVEELNSQVKVQRFEQTSSTRLELQTLLWALGSIQTAGRKLTVYSDSQNIIGLPARRERLEQRDYRSNQNRRLKHYLLYQEFYRLTDQQDCHFVKIRGHRPQKQKAFIDQLFSLVDRASRKALREATKAPAPTTKDN